MEFPEVTITLRCPAYSTEVAVKARISSIKKNEAIVRLTAEQWKAIEDQLFQGKAEADIVGAKDITILGNVNATSIDLYCEGLLIEGWNL